MPASRFYSTALPPSASSKSQALAHRPHASVNKENLAILRASRQIASGKYQDAIREACTVIENKIAAIAEAHGKSVKRVRGDIHMGAQVSLKQHSRQSGWNAFMWMEAKKDKENRVEDGRLLITY